MSDNPTTDIQSLLQFFQSRVTERPESSRRAYSQALTTFRTYLHTLPDDQISFTAALIADWCIHMSLGGMTPKTISQYLNVISALYGAAVKEDKAAPTEAFAIIKDALGKIDWTRMISEEDFGRMQKVTKSAPLQKGETSIATDLLLMSLLQGSRPIADLIELRRETKPENTDFDIYNISEYNPEIADEIEALIERQSDPRRKYIFDLNQSRLTPRQREKKGNGMILDLLRLRNVPLYGGIRATIDSYWAYAALRGGATPADILSILRYVPEGVPILSLANAAFLAASNAASGKGKGTLTSPEKEEGSGWTEVPAYRRLAINEVVASIFIENPLRWYAMKLRPYVKFDELADRFKVLRTDAILKTPDIFYPYEEIAKKIGKKLVFDKKPIIRDIVFFRSRVTDIYPMFTKIGDLAWCYTTQGKSGKTYAAIPNSSFMVFQKTIGYFTPDYKVAPIGALAPVPGEKIVVIGGLFNGTTATFAGTVDATQPVHTTQPSKGTSHQPAEVTPKTDTLSQDTADETTTSILYRLNFISDNGIEWRINVDSRQVAH